MTSLLSQNLPLACRARQLSQTPSRNLTIGLGLRGPLRDIVLSPSVGEHNGHSGYPCGERPGPLQLGETPFKHVLQGQPCHGALAHVLDVCYGFLHVLGRAEAAQGELGADLCGILEQAHSSSFGGDGQGIDDPHEKLLHNLKAVLSEALGSINHEDQVEGTFGASYGQTRRQLMQLQLIHALEWRELKLPFETSHLGGTTFVLL